MKAKKLPPQSLLLTLLSYDKTTGQLLWKEREALSRHDKSWNTRYANRPAFTTVGDDNYLRGRISGRDLLAHRVIWKMVTGEDPDEVDHLNGDRTDNRWLNLRSVPRYLNMRNQKRRSDNTSGHTGVFWDRKLCRWRATIRDQGKTKHLGLFDDIYSAVEARKQAQSELNYHKNHGR